MSVSPADYGSSLEEDIQADTSGYLERILVCLLQVSRSRLLGAPCLEDPSSWTPGSGSWTELLG